MNNSLAKGQRVRCNGRAEVGTVESIDGHGYATVHFEARPGTVTKGYYPVDLVAPATERERPRASARDILGEKREAILDAVFTPLQ